MPTRNNLKLRFLPAIPGTNALSFTLRAEEAADQAEAAAALAIAAGITEPILLLTDGPTVTLDASLSRTFELVAAGNRTILAPVNAPGSGQTEKLIIRHKASGGNRLLTLAPGAGGFRFGATIPALSATLTGLTDWIGCLWNFADNCWDVVAYAKGF